MNIGIIGSGNMGSSLGKIWVKNGHKVLFSHSRDEQKLKALVESAGSNAQAGTPIEAAQFGDVVMLAVAPPALNQVPKVAEALKGKALISCVSPFKADFEGRTVGLKATIELTTSMAEEIARLAPGAKVVEAFNLTYAELLESPSRQFDREQASIPYCGDDKSAKAIAASLIQECGFEAVDAGPLINARSLEPLATIWAQLGGVMGLFPDVALKVLQR